MTPAATPARRRGPGRPLKRQDNTSSALCQLGALLRRLRADRGLTLMAVGQLTGYSWQHIGAIERGQVAPSEEVIAACERALAAGGQLAAMFPSVVREMLVSVEAHLSLLASLLRGSQPEPMRHRIASAAVEAAGFAAWLWFDLGDQFKAGALYEMAGSLLHEAGSPALGCYIAGYRALAAEAAGLSDEAINHARSATSRSSTACSALAHSWLSAINANVIALTGDDRRTLNLLGQARDSFDVSSGKEQWMYDFDYSALAVYRGQCHLRLRQPHEAIGAFESGLASLPPGCERRSAYLAIGLAGAYLSAGQPDAGVFHASRALEVFARSGSAAGLIRVQAFRRSLADAGHDRAAEGLDGQLRGHITTLP